MFISLWMVHAAELVWIVDNTKCHVSADSTARLAVSLSLISHTIIISGSCLRSVLSQLANVYHTSGFTWDWFTNSILYSIGSSRVDILSSRGLKFLSIPKRVVVFHEPVGHVINMIPYVFLRAFLTISKCTSISHSASIFVRDSSGFSILITIFSQYFVGRVEKRISIFCSSLA